MWVFFSFLFCSQKIYWATCASNHPTWVFFISFPVQFQDTTLHLLWLKKYQLKSLKKCIEKSQDKRSKQVFFRWKKIIQFIAPIFPNYCLKICMIWEWLYQKTVVHIADNVILSASNPGWSLCVIWARHFTPTLLCPTQ